MAISLLQYLKEPRSLIEVASQFNAYSPSVIEKALKQYQSLSLIHTVNENHRQVCVLLIGAGSAGSHIVNQLANLDIDELVIVDKDIVEESNVFRQC